MGWGGGDFILGRAIPDPCPHKGRGDPEERPLRPEPPSPAAGGPAGGHSPGAAASPGRAAARCLSPAHPTPAARWGSLAVVVQSAVKASVTLKYLSFLRSRWPPLSRGGLLVPSESSGAAPYGSEAFVQFPGSALSPVPRTSSCRGSCRLGVAGTPAPQRRPHLAPLPSGRHSAGICWTFFIILATCK